MQTQHDCKSLREEVPDILGTSDNFLKSQHNNVLDRLLELASEIHVAKHSICALTFSEIRWS